MRKQCLYHKVDRGRNKGEYPESPSRPSGEDKRLAHDPGADYLILSLQDRDCPVLNAFRIKNHADVSKEEIRYVRYEENRYEFFDQGYD